MNRKDFMGRLEELLMDIPTEERVEAMAFYHSYFEDAGEENEERVIRELESPEKVAASIKADMSFEPAREEAQEPWTEKFALVRKVREEDRQAEGNTQAEDTQGGYTQTEDTRGGYTQTEDTRGGYTQTEYTQAGTDTGSGGQQSGQKKDDTFKIVMIVIVAVLTSPIWLGLLGGLLGLILGALGTIIGFAVAMVAIVFSLYLAGVAMCGVSIAAFSGGAAAIGFGLLGAGLLLLVFAVLGTILCVWVCGSFLPWAVKGIISLCKRPFQKKEKGGYAA